MKTRTLTVAFLVLGLLAMMTPTGVAASQRSDSITPFFTTPTLSSTNFHELDLAEDESLDLTLEWTDSNTDLDLIVAEPGGTCEVLPTPEVGCLAAGAQDNALAAACQKPVGQGETAGFGPGTETVSLTAEQSGTHTVFVAVSSGIPNQTVEYTLTAESGQDLGQPDSINLIRSSGHCRGVATPS